MPQQWVLCGWRGGYDFDPLIGVFRLLVRVELDQPRHRVNDGFVDQTGRVWLGTMNEDAQTRGGGLYTLENDMTVCTHDADYVVTNGPAISPDGRTLYHTDSAARTVYAFDLSVEGTLPNKRLILHFPLGIYPDGTAIDEDGALWVALFNAWRLDGFSPKGERLRGIRLPCANITKPAFGGADRRTLYVTTACAGLTPEARVKQLQAGGLFAVSVHTLGLAIWLAR